MLQQPKLALNGPLRDTNPRALQEPGTAEAFGRKATLLEPVLAAQAALKRTT